MALIKCPECGKQISSAAGSCPGCGHPIKGAQTQARQVVTVEQTGKKWKLLQLIAALMLIFGVFGVIANAGNSEPTLAAPVTIGGFALLIAARFGAWWHHK